MVKQNFRVTLDGEVVEIGYKYSILSGKTELVVDGASFVVKGKPFGIGVERREPIMIGGTQAILDVKRGGRAQIVVRDGEVEEI